MYELIQFPFIFTTPPIAFNRLCYKKSLSLCKVQLMVHVHIQVVLLSISILNYLGNSSILV